MKRVLVAMVLIFLLFSSTNAVYAEVYVTEEDVLDSISEFYLVVQKVRSNNDHKLVPQGVIRAVGDVYTIEFTYEVIVKEGLDLHVDINDVLFSNSNLDIETLRNTFVFDVNQTVTDTIDYHEQMLSEEVSANIVTVSVIVSMNQPPTFEIYQMLAGGSLTFEVYFFAV